MYKKISIQVIFYSRKILFSRSLSSRLHQKIKEELLPSLVSKNFEENKFGDWTSVRNSLLETNLLNTSIDSIIINYCCYSKKFSIGLEYWKYLQKNNLTPNLAATGNYLQLLYHLSFRCEDRKSDIEDEIIRLCDNINEQFKIIDSKTSEKIAQALSVTKKWRDSLSLLNNIKLTSTPSIDIYSSIIAACFDNFENELGWKLASEMIDVGKLPKTFVYSTFLYNVRKNASSNEDAKKKIEELLMFFRENVIILSKKDIQELVIHFKNLNGSSKFSEINSRGICKNCSNKLNRLHLSEDDLNKLKKEFLEFAFVGNDLFYKTNPKEFAKLQNFLKTEIKYEVVIDGLNVAYSSGLKQSSEKMLFLVASTVNYFKKIGKKNILVVGRSHMQKWSQKYWDFITENANVFLVESLSQDDPFLLYCALNSTSETVIVSKDLMRNHLFRLKSQHQKKLFTRWLNQNQFQLIHVKNNGSLFFQRPLPYELTTQKCGTHWHIPYQTEAKEDAKNKNIQKPPIEWICLEV